MISAGTIFRKQGSAKRKRMKKEEIHLNDIHRILFGQAPAEFLIEVLLRTAFIYLALLIVLKLLGKRMDGQITIIEMAVMITLGAIVSVGMQLPDRGILLSFTALLCIVFFQFIINRISLKHKKIEEASEGTMNILVKDGVLQLEDMLKTGITKQNLFASLRNKKILNLGKVKRVYFEACGLMNVYEENKAKPGLPIFPSDEKGLIDKNTRKADNHIACKNCGYVKESKDNIQLCPVCQQQEWMEAIF
jgi:uncharacterized membrane protein YcaP (DUF421 family)